MSGRILPFPNRLTGLHGIVHVMGHSVDGFTVSHESASGSSWGALFGPFRSGQEAISVAYALNRDEYEGACEVFVGPAVLLDAEPDVGLPSLPGDF